MTSMVVKDYRELDCIPEAEDIQVTVLSSGFVYRFERGHWSFVERRRTVSH